MRGILGRLKVTINKGEKGVLASKVGEFKGEILMIKKN